MGHQLIQEHPCQETEGSPNVPIHPLELERVETSPYGNIVLREYCLQGLVYSTHNKL